MYQEQVAARALDHPPLAVGQQAFIGVQLRQFVTGQYLLQAVEVLDAGQAWIAAQGGGAAREAQAFRRDHRARQVTHDAAHLHVRGRTIAASARAPGEQDLDHTMRLLADQAPHLEVQPLFIGGRQSQACAAGTQAGHVALPVACLSCPHTKGLEQAVSELQAAIAEGDVVLFDAVDQVVHRRGHAFSSRSASSRPRALARVSSSSRSGRESATMPAPARRLSRSPSRTRVRIRMFRSILPSRLR